MKSRRGSAAAIALVMMMFLLVAGLAWLPMLTQETQVAKTDSSQQQAAYCAEAGMLRAMTELKKDSTDWAWTATAKTEDSFKEKQQALDYTKQGTDNVDAYSVYVTPTPTLSDQPDGSKKVVGSFTVTSVGYSGGTRKVIEQTVKVGLTNLEYEILKIYNWAAAQPTTTVTDYLTLQRQWLEAVGGSGYQLTDEDLEELFGGRDKIYKDQIKTEIWLRFMGVNINGVLQPIVYVTNHPNVVGINAQENMRALAIMYKDTTYYVNDRTAGNGASKGYCGTYVIGGAYLHSTVHNATKNQTYTNIEDFMDSIYFNGKSDSFVKD